MQIVLKRLCFALGTYATNLLASRGIVVYAVVINITIYIFTDTIHDSITVMSKLILLRYELQKIHTSLTMETA